MPVPRPVTDSLACCAPTTSTRNKVTIGPSTHLLLAEELLEQCLLLDDVNLLWLTEAIFRSKPHVLQRLLESLLLVKPPKGSAFRTRSFAPPLEDLKPGDNASGRYFQAACLETDDKKIGAHDVKEKLLPLALEHNFKLPLETKEVPGQASDEDTAPKLSASRMGEPLRRTISQSSESVMSFVPRGDLVHEAGVLFNEFIQRDTDLHGPRPVCDVPVVQFESRIAFCEEGGSGCLPCYVVRIGDVSRMSRVEFETSDISAKSGVHYVEKSGTIVFDIGEKRKLITISIVNNKAWSPSSEMHVNLLLHGTVNARVNESCSFCVCYIIDDDYFPTNKFCTQMSEGKIREISPLSLMKEFLKYCILNKTTRSGLYKVFALETLRSLIIILTLFLNMQMVDTFACTSCTRGNGIRKLTLIMIGLSVPCAIIHWLDVQKCLWKIKGSARSNLLKGVLVKFLYSDASSHSFSNGRLVAAVTRDCEELVCKSLAMIPLVITGTARWVIVLVYTIACSIVDNDYDATNEGTFWKSSLGVSMLMGLCLFVLLPTLKLIFLKRRHSSTVASIEAMNAAGNQLLELIDEVMNSLNLISDYQMKTNFARRFDKAVGIFNTTAMQSESMVAQNGVFAKVCSLALQTVFIFTGGSLVLDGEWSIGAFLNCLSIMRLAGNVWDDVYGSVVAVQQSYDALHTLMFCLNCPSELNPRLKLHDHRRRLQLKQEQIVMEQDTNPNMDVLDRLCVNFWKSERLDGLPCAVFPQGGLYTLVGPPCSGKGTVLRKLADAYRDDIGFFAIPLHLRRIHVTQYPMFLTGSLLFNLTIGCTTEKSANKDRVLSICKAMGLPDSILDIISSQKFSDRWGETLSSTESSMLHIARGIIADPEILLVHQPGSYFNDEQRASVYWMLKTFVINRGIEVDMENVYHRRPRTCFITARRISGQGSSLVDACIHVTKETGLQLIRRNRSCDAQEK
eukprot:TRINITY_DN7051_c0_g1_i1.p1 TRINITY_DN7051_c0_g1~~TRINITY_DN7051_c0_g1_i1.p1  ORF type:complete len:963 (+),score=109.94 TRINITY_DN7051_c0_g1_i1:168-3056(+)